jgi:hypothetical protein
MGLSLLTLRIVSCVGVLFVLLGSFYIYIVFNDSDFLYYLGISQLKPRVMGYNPCDVAVPCGFRLSVLLFALALLTFTGLVMASVAMFYARRLKNSQLAKLTERKVTV